MKRGTAMGDVNFTLVNKKEGNGNGNSVINNHERNKNKASDYVSGDSTPSSSSHKFEENPKK